MAVTKKIEIDGKEVTFKNIYLLIVCSKAIIL